MIAKPLKNWIPSFVPAKCLAELLTRSRTNWLELLATLKPPSWDSSDLKTSSYLRIFSTPRCQPSYSGSLSPGCQSLCSGPGLLPALLVWLTIWVPPSFSLTHLGTFQSRFSAGEGDLANQRRYTGLRPAATGGVTRVTPVLPCENFCLPPPLSLAS